VSLPISSLFERQKEALSRGPSSTAKERIEKLDRLRRAIEASKNEILGAVHADFRKSPAESLLSEIFVVTTEIRSARRSLRRWMRPRRVPSRLSYFGARGEIRREPKGLVLILSPWNFPFQLAVGPLVSAVAAGNRVILKPSEFTPHTSGILKKLLSEVFPCDEVAVVEGDAAVAGKLLELPFDHIFFTGSTAVGRIVLAAAAKTLASVTLELGGKCPVLLDDTADLREAATKIAWGKFLNAGQTCVAPDYVVVSKERVDEFVAEMRRAIASLFGPAESLSSNPDYCRLVSPRHLASVRAMLDDNPDMAVILSKVAGFSWSTAQCILLRAANRHLSVQDLDRALSGFSRLRAGTARSIIEFYDARRHGADAASAQGAH